MSKVTKNSSLQERAQYAEQAHQKELKRLNLGKQIVFKLPGQYTKTPRSVRFALWILRRKTVSLDSKYFDLGDKQ